MIHFFDFLNVLVTHTVVIQDILVLVLKILMAEFIVCILEAHDLKETELVGKQDPYVEIRTNQDRKCTAVHQNGGKNPGRFLLFLLSF